MALKVTITHKTLYKYDRKVNLSPHIIRLRPAPHSRTPIEAYSIKIKPENHFFNWQQDPFGNYLARLVFPEKTEELSVAVEIIADMKTINPFDFFVEEYAEQYPFTYKPHLQQELLPYLEIKEKGTLLKEWIQTIDTSPKKTIDFLIGLNQKLYQYLDYTVRMEVGVQACETTLTKKLGSCRDFAWLMVQTLRHLGIASRFVSGYLVQLKADEKSLDGPSGPEKDFTDLHAWVEAYVPGAGWIGLDATSGLLAGEGHIPLACTPNYESAAPIEGLTDVCETEFFYENSVKRIFESPRVTKPYTEAQWEAIYQLGFKVDKKLEEGDVRLTMGGEPTFVSIDDMESPEWNTAADGDHKRQLAGDLSRKLLETFGKNGMLHHAQGKWYPGEPLPRWEIGLYWRKDKKPIWKDESLFAKFTEKGTSKKEDANTFLNTLTSYLGCPKETVTPVFEDTFYFLWEQGNLPLDVDPSELELKEVSVKQKIDQVLNQTPGEAEGYVLPLAHYKNQWISNQWKVRRKKIFLLPGNSPIGLRLPLNSLLVDPEIPSIPVYEPDLFALKEALPEITGMTKKKASAIDHKTPFVRTALCAEVREGKLYLFLPPIEDIAAFLELLTAIEATASELQIPITLEGYAPPKDNRIEVLKITPDPGVIEVNVHPVTSWKALTENTLTLYEEAKKSRLGTEKFLIDGRHTGTGGGNHVTLGGITPADSPLLRKPRLLQRLLTFWQHHPGLSYLFSGAFIGPTSQAPRVDEARLENLYELEIAFDQIPKDGEIPFWVTDRLFRHMLTDLTGNTHRAEFCIDKLYSPDSSSGRLGILELRAFDMPPHAQMSLMQLLLVRTLVAWLWEHPYEKKLVRWGTQLHDKFLMEHYVKEDIADIVRQLNEAGYPFQLDWFDPFFEFRFPLLGMTKIQAMELELRMAIEPWHVLGEEMAGGATSRYVDSSLERVQVKVTNFTDERYSITCNGVKIPMAATETKGTYVGGVRYKAWQPWSALHPTIETDTPLVFDIIDTWNQKSIGGCTYFVAHPGGLSYDKFPVNSYEAESRRINRFWNFNHTQGEIPDHVSEEQKNLVKNKNFDYQELPINQEYPHTLDLRKKRMI
ncbi:transglutaminase family protein [Aquimarina sp. ERC-38]|uniref:transglutaminase family protein n=1 Tax=Aquimarina sp. ERC-38 TaxID=2949996 RepID=UPI002247C8C4|nr:transglutaminase family protein [Aquimarina sp. ERC-38]UZO82362.1 transglutaminase family protein [Aquimarina sp. ERC-38]